MLGFLIAYVVILTVGGFFVDLGVRERRAHLGVALLCLAVVLHVYVVQPAYSALTVSVSAFNDSKS
jgi:biotin transporter BioY